MKHVRYRKPRAERIRASKIEDWSDMIGNVPEWMIANPDKQAESQPIALAA